MVTPEQVEKRLLELSKEVDASHAESMEAEHKYTNAKVAFEMNMAKARLIIGQSNAKLRIGDIQDKALIKCEGEYQDLMIAEAIVKAARSNANRVKTQVDIARSIGTSVRASLDM